MREVRAHASGCAGSRCASSFRVSRTARRRGIYIAKGQVVCTRPLLGPSGLEWQAALAAVARAEPTLAPEAADDLRVLASFMRRPPPELDGASAGTLHVMEELRERARSDGWRKLVVDGVTATPVDLTRGPALKVVDGARTETVSKPAGPSASTRCSPTRATSTCSLPTATCMRAARRRAAGSCHTAGRRRMRRRAAATTGGGSIRFPPIIRCSARRGSRATRSGRCSTTSSCCVRCRSGSATAFASSTRAAARRT